MLVGTAGIAGSLAADLPVDGFDVGNSTVGGLAVGGLAAGVDLIGDLIVAGLTVGVGVVVDDGVLDVAKKSHGSQDRKLFVADIVEKAVLSIDNNQTHDLVDDGVAVGPRLDRAGHTDMVSGIENLADIVGDNFGDIVVDVYFFAFVDVGVRVVVVDAKLQHPFRESVVFAPGLTGLPEGPKETVVYQNHQGHQGT